jgi:hypothetical protein
MAVGGGKKHGRLWIADSCIDSSGLSLSKIRSESATSGLTIRTRPSPAQTRVDELQVIPFLRKFSLLHFPEELLKHGIQIL